MPCLPFAGLAVLFVHKEYFIRHDHLSHSLLAISDRAQYSLGIHLHWQFICRAERYTYPSFPATPSNYLLIPQDPCRAVIQSLHAQELDIRNSPPAPLVHRRQTMTMKVTPYSLIDVAATQFELRNQLISHHLGMGATMPHVQMMRYQG